MHIEYLLLKHDCVTVPGFGAFIVVNEKPIFDLESGVISPMMREVRFNSALRADDGLLASSYARKYSLTYREASELLSRDIASLFSFLEIEKEVSLGGIGVISMSEEGNLLFQPFRTASKLAMDLGFLAVPFVKKQVDSAKENSDKKESSTQETPRKVSISSQEKKFDLDRNYYIAINKVFAKSVAAILFAFTICLAALFPSTNRNIKEDRASVVPVDKIIETVVNTTNPVVEEFSEEQVVRPDSLSDSSLSHYYLIVGTFRTEAEAEKYLSMHAESSYDLEIITSGKVSRVSAGKSEDRASLQETMNDKDFREAFKESWIWENAN